MSEKPTADHAADDAARQEILTLVEDWAKALVSNDADTISGFMDDDWVVVGTTGIMDKQEFLSLTKSGAATHETMELVGAARIQIYGDTAVLTVRDKNSGSFKGQPFTADEWITHVFRRRAEGRWLCVLNHVTPAEA